MLRILLDENIPIGLKSLLSALEVRTADEMGWAGITNGRLLDAAQTAGFQLMVTADQNIRAQQRSASLVAKSPSSSSAPITGTRSERAWRW